jgi:hypothetical protein
VEEGFIKLDPHFNVIEVCLVDRIMERTSIVLEVDHVPDYNLKRPLIQALTCVEVAKAVLGISKWNLWTPYQLYKHVLNYYQPNLYFYRNDHGRKQQT